MRANDFLLACQKNELRRLSGLPLLNIREEMAKEARRRQLLHFRQGFELHKDQFAEIRHDVLNQLRREHGTDFNLSGGGRMVVSIKTMRSYEDFLRDRGFERPLNPAPIRYGEQHTR